MSFVKLIIRPGIDYIVFKVNPGLTSCEDLALALHSNEICFQK